MTTKYFDIQTKNQHGVWQFFMRWYGNLAGARNVMPKGGRIVRVTETRTLIR